MLSEKCFMFFVDRVASVAESRQAEFQKEIKKSLFEFSRQENSL